MREIDVDQLEQAVADGATVIDVREPREYAEAHVRGSTLIPMGQLPSRMAQLDKDAPVYLVCRSGNRSGAMAQLLSANQFDAVNVRGGMIAWVRAGKTYEQGLEAGALS